MRTSVLAIWFAVAIAAAPCRAASTDGEAAATSAAARAAVAANVDDAFLILNGAIPSFGGLYLDKEGVAHVYMLSSSEESKARPVIADFLKRLGYAADTKSTQEPRIAFQPGKFSWFDLDGFRYRVRDIFNLAGVVYLDADEQRNVVTIGISSEESRTQIEKFLKEVQLPEGAVHLTVVPPIQLLADLNDQFRPLEGGIKIKNDVGPFAFLGFAGICTMTATAVLNGVPGFITASHCTRTQGQVDGGGFFQNGLTPFSLDLVGFETVDPTFTPSLIRCPTGRLCRKSDSAFVRLIPNMQFTLGAIAKPAATCTSTPCSTALNNPGDALRITGPAPIVLAGLTINKIGRTTGFTGGPLSAACVDIAVPGNPILVLLCQDFVTAVASFGDSGSPVFTSAGGSDVRLAGVLWGGTAVAPGFPPTFFFSSQLDVIAELGPSLNFVAPTLPAAPPAGSGGPENACQAALAQCMRDVGKAHGPRPEQCLRERGDCR